MAVSNKVNNYEVWRSIILVKRVMLCIDYCVKATTAASHNMYFLQYSIFTTSANVTHRRDKNKGHAERAIVFCFSAMGVQP